MRGSPSPAHTAQLLLAIAQIQILIKFCLVALKLFIFRSMVIRTLQTMKRHKSLKRVSLSHWMIIAKNSSMCIALVRGNEMDENMEYENNVK